MLVSDARGSSAPSDPPVRRATSGPVTDSMHLTRIRCAPLLLPWVVLAATATGAAIQAQTAAPTEIAVPKGAITPEELRDLIVRLASDDFEGRGSGEAGGHRAAEFIAEQLRARGARPAGEDGGWFQPFSGGGRGGDASFRNVAGMVPGKDEKLRDEYVVVGAHYDHCGFGASGGMGNRGEIHHGADDNASGTAAVLAIARAVAADPLPRSVLFLLFDAEERGLLGSLAYCDKPLVPLDRTVAMLNIDMIGRSHGGYVFVGGLGSSPQWESVVSKALRTESRFLKKIERNEDNEARSDNDSFYKKDIPVLFFFTNLHRDYHQPRDTPDKIQYKPAAAIARAILATLRGVAERKERMSFSRTGSNGMPKGLNSLEASVFKRAVAMNRRLGGSIGAGPGGAPQFVDTVPDGNRAGFEKGDVILAIAPGSSRKRDAWTEVKTVEELRRAVEAFAPGDSIQLRIRRGSEEKEISTRIGDVPEWKHGPDKETSDLPIGAPKGR